ncbi:hypothetical protein QA645_41000 [Bradyrhizobium sp. CIAT3101]|uniref:hypothetical protein n=1 Tax=Bradyrhizobium sp. CIAT3101 TaxID=439387 RepID=UPI0024B1A209|nr:hypothetical protein [Bradyrhizobium sp. CIAT3101]WFU80728.1 hypothetical protein QA645_41000 [Bradyrhizobium sp. CIAT3101]
MSRMLWGSAGAFIATCHSGAYRAHRERIRGFSDYLMQHADSHHDFDLVIFAHDNNLLSAERLTEALRGNNRVIGLYSVGAGREGIAAALNAHHAKVFWVGHALSQSTAICLRSGLMDICIDGAPEIQARRSLDLVLRRLGLIDVDVSNAPVQFLRSRRRIWPILLPCVLSQTAAGVSSTATDPNGSGARIRALVAELHRLAARRLTKPR